MTLGAGENVDVNDLLVQHHSTGKHKGVDNLQNSTSTPSGPVVGDVWVEPITGGSGAAATATVTSNAIASVAVTAGGTAYTGAPTITLSGGSPSTDAVLLAVINGSGVVTSVTVTSGGAGYSSVPTLTFTDPNVPGRLQVCYTAGSFTQVTSGSSAAGLSQVSSNDSTPGYLNGKLVAGTNITLTEGNDAGNETLTIAAVVPANIVAHYAGGTSAPTGWSIYAEGTGRVILGMDAAWTLGSEVGTQFASNAATRTITQVPNHVHSVNPPSTASDPGGSHSHTYNNVVSGGTNGFTASGGSDTQEADDTSTAPNHEHNVDIPAFDSANNTSGVASVDVTMPYVQLLPIKKDS